MVLRRNSSLEKLKIPDKKVPTLAAFRNTPFKMLLELTKQKNAEKDTINLKNTIYKLNKLKWISLFFFTGKLHNDLPEQRALTLSRQRFYVIGTSAMKELMAFVVSQIRWINSMTEVF